MRYRLRTLLIVLTLGPLLLAVLIWIVAFVLAPWEEGPPLARGKRGLTIQIGEHTQLYFGPAAQTEPNDP